MAKSKKSKKASKAKKSRPAKKVVRIKAKKKKPAAAKKTAKKPAKPRKVKKAARSIKKTVKKASKKKVAAKKPIKKSAKKAKKAAVTPKSKAKKVSAPAPKKETKPKGPLFPIKRQVSAPREISAGKRLAQTKLNKGFLDKQNKKLVELRNHILNQMQGVAQDGLRSRDESSGSSAFGMHQADAGSDAYEKDFALSLLSQEQDALYEIEEAVKRIENKTYGVCEMSGKPIPKARLEAIPFARYTVECQALMERENRGRRRWDTAPQFMDSADHFFEEEDEGDDEEKNKVKE